MKKTIQDISLILLGSLLFAVGISYFTIPNMLSEGGIIGITVIVHYLFGWSPGIVNLILNASLLLVGLKYFEKRTIIYTLITIGASSGFLYITEEFGRQLTEDTLLAAIFAGLLVGAGIGFILRAGGTSGGTTILARLVNQLWGWSMGTIILVMDIIVVASSAFIIGLDKAMYTLIVVYIGAKAIDFIVEGLDERVAVMIVSAEPDRILQTLTTKMSRGLTVLEGRGGYSGVQKDVLYIVISKHELAQVKNIIKGIDQSAYVTVHGVHEMAG
ncbi:MAG TPA: YitT family protein [Bacillus sp. (in: firmicutes)]|uniref:YitT family protein n=1 Tax=Bacillus litorisediminis TaxID=2922713 RepID=UPI001FAEB340|nr:YitT family protein [Bacillus litorisediminis]HWO78236.1 YitT family protein [Bacillus sp. (in: firmicutes)]